MKKLTVLFFSMMLFLGQKAFAGGEMSVGVSPGTDFTGTSTKFFGSFQTDFRIGFTVQFEYAVDEEEKHQVGADFGGEFGTGFTPNFGKIRPFYKFNFNTANDGAYAGGYVNISFASNRNIIGIGGLGGYEYRINDDFSVYGQGNVGFGSIGVFGSRGNGLDWGIQIGANYIIGKKD